MAMPLLFCSQIFPCCCVAAALCWVRASAQSLFSLARSHMLTQCASQLSPIYQHRNSISESDMIFHKATHLSLLLNKRVSTRFLTGPLSYVSETVKDKQNFTSTWITPGSLRAHQALIIQTVCIQFAKQSAVEHFS